ncbi:hypothetical protein [Gimesia fumaroli]|uniref:Uncharacterized protein n=1 Tax=Gimesia fumaroli TaxID=2527976 RepID=A0A518I958_9PLAN|nr:hypothetical protein [Gimesia fumaroli]QDV49594.1 hypothetical protein Enr17x_16140 [Gimesia fumaroli]
MISLPVEQSTSNSQTLSDQFKTIIDGYKDYTVGVHKRAVAHCEGRLAKCDPAIKGVVNSELKDAKRQLSVAQTFEVLKGLKPNIVLACELKQDVDFVSRELETALVESSIASPVDAPCGSVNFDKPEVTLPDEISIEVMGDALPVSVDLIGATLTLNRIEDGNAIYTVSIA